MPDAKINIAIDISSLINFMQNNVIISLIGIGSILFAIVKLIRVILKHNRERSKEVKKQRKVEYKNLKKTLLQLQNKELSSINNILFNKNISLPEIMDITDKIHTFYTKDNKIFLAQSSLFENKIFIKIKQKNIKYRHHVSPSNVPLTDINTDIDKENLEDITKLAHDTKNEIDKIPLYVKTQLNLYLEFNQLLFDELSNIQKKLAKQLGL